jgi:nitroreductase
MEFLEIIEERRSVRKFYPKPIPMELVGELLYMATKAPSIGDLQPWNFIVVTKANRLQEIADACPYERWLYQAPLIIAVCALSEKVETYYPGKGKLWASHSIAAAAQNICNGAVDLGLGSCWVTSFETYKIREVLHIPEGIEPEILIAIGYPDEEPVTKRLRPLHTNMFFNEYGASSTDISLHKRDYGEFVRDRLEDVKQRAAYETAPRGGVRTSVENVRTRFKELFRKGGGKAPKEKEPVKEAPETGHVRVKEEAAQRERVKDPDDAGRPVPGEHRR